MMGRELVKEIQNRRSTEHNFVRFSRKENDFSDYDLIDRFMENVSGNEEIEGIDLLTMDDVWNVVKRVCGDNVKIIHMDKGDEVEWVHRGKSGLKTLSCPFTPETLIDILDVETKGNTIK